VQAFEQHRVARWRIAHSSSSAANMHRGERPTGLLTAPATGFRFHEHETARQPVVGEDSAASKRLLISPALRFSSSLIFSCTAAEDKFQPPFAVVAPCC